MRYIEEVMQKILRENTNQPEFLQAESPLEIFNHLERGME